MQGVWVQSLAEELGFHMPPGQKNQNIKQKQYCNKFIDFKMVPIKKKIFFICSFWSYNQYTVIIENS